MPRHERTGTSTRTRKRRPRKREANQPKEAPVNPPKFLTVEEVAEMLRIKVRTVYEMVSQNRIPFRKAGRRTVFLLDEILEWTAPHQ